MRQAAAAWHEAGVLDDAGLAAVEARHPDDSGRLGPVLRTLVGAFAAFGVLVSFGLAMVVLRLRDETAIAFVLLLFGAGLGVLTELQMGPLKRMQAGAETATGLLSILSLTLGFVFLLEGMSLAPRAGVVLVLAFTAFLSGAAALRWGSVTAALSASLAVFGLLAQPPGGRLLWMVAGSLFPLFLLRASDSGRLAPPHRKCLVGASLVALAALYLAFHLGSWDSGLVGWLSAWRWSGEWGPDIPPAGRAVAIAGSAILPLAVTAAGIWSRRRSLLLAGVLMGAASLVTLRFYVQVMPLSSALVLVGALTILVVLVVRRVLDRGAGHERWGFTGERLYDSPTRMQLLETAVGIVSLSPPSKPEDASTDFEGGRGSSGGGGATSSF